MNNTSDANIFRNTCAIQLYVVIAMENSPSFKAMIGPRPASRRFRDRSNTRSNFGLGLELQTGRRSHLGHEPTFGTLRI
jgi:hypothetical protein